LWVDVVFDEGGVFGEVVVGEGFDFGGFDLCCELFGVDFVVVG